MTARQARSTEVDWRARERDDAPVAQRAIIRTMLRNHPPVCRKRSTWTGGRVAYQPDADAEVAS
jgi:hypothetical protein